MKPEPKSIMKHPLLLITGKASPALMLTAGLCLALTLPSQARNTIDGTLGGQLEPNGAEFTNTTSGNFNKVDASVDADWWVIDGDPFVPIVQGSDGKDIMTHITEPLGADDSFWMGIAYEYPQSPVDGKKGIKAAFYGVDGTEGSRSLAGAEIWLGINFWDEAENGLIAELGNAIISGDGTTPDWTQNFGTKTTNHLADNGFQSTPTVSDGFIASEIPNDIDLWKKFTVGADDPGKDWGLAIDTETDSYILNWVVGIVLPDTFSDSAVSDDVIAEGSASNVADDILFRWTIDEKGLPLTDPASPFSGDPPKNPDYATFGFEEVVVIPEPSSAGLLMLGALALVMRRKRA